MESDKTLTQLDLYLFGNGTHYEIYEKMGAHPMTLEGRQGVYFSVWAPHAQKVSVVGDFNQWNPKSNEMKPLENSGIFETFIPGLQAGALYKFAVTTPRGDIILKADPYGFYSELRPNTASRVADLSRFSWTDSSWMEKRSTWDPLSSPLSVYEVHLGSWKRHAKELSAPHDTNFYHYRESAKALASYVKEMGYTHVELIGIAEHPLDASWGYQVTGYYAPTSRYGSPEDFMYFVNYMHRNHIGVILDWVPAHFPKDAHGLADFDGTPTYEYADPRKGEHPDWGTKVFDYSKHEVSNFLIANALYWVEKYHIDGLRVDAVASMLYLDYGRQPGGWVPNRYGGHENLEAIEFFRHLNSIMKTRNPGAMVIAEESTAWPGVTKSPAEGGLGFTFKWNMGWMHDFLEYMSLDPYFRKYNHNKMTFGLTYFTSENFILVLSHDEVVHLKRSMINKMPGEYEEKFSNLKAAYTFMMGHPGKKLLFMGQDFGQFAEWNENKELDWYLEQEPFHQDLKAYYRRLLKLYRRSPALYANDYSWEGFEWINCDDSDRSIFSFIRKNPSGRGGLLFIVNFTPVDRPDYRVGVPKRGKYTLIVDSLNPSLQTGDPKSIFHSEKIAQDQLPHSLAFPLSGYQAMIFRY